MKYLIILLLSLLSIISYSQQDEYYRTVDWKFYPSSIIQLTDSTYEIQAIPYDYNDPGAINRIVGNYVVDYVGHRYEVIDSSSTTITVKDIYHTGQAPQSLQIARCYRSVVNKYNRTAEFIGSVDYSPLDESSRWKLNGADNALLWRSMLNIEQPDSTGQIPTWNQDSLFFETIHNINNLATRDSQIVSIDVLGASEKTINLRRRNGSIITGTFLDLGKNSHSELTNLGWTVSNHSDGANKIAAFDATGAATTLDTITNLASQYDLTLKQNVLTNPVTGTGTTNYVTKWTGTTTQGNSQIFDNGTNVLLGTTLDNSSGKLQINGGSVFGTTTKTYIRDVGTAISINRNPSNGIISNSSFSGLNLAVTANYSVISNFTTTGSSTLSQIYMFNSGNTGIGTSAVDNGVDRLQVNGSILGTTAKFTNLTDGYIPKHTSDATGLQNSNIFFSGNIARYGTANTFSNDRDIVDKAYVDAIAAGNMPKLPVDAATTGNITLSGTQTIDGYSAGVGARILVWKQTTTSQNGVYIVASGAWTRATDLDTWAELYKAYVTVLNGAQSGSSFVCTVPSTGTLGTDPVTWILYNAPTNITVSAPLVKSGNNISLGYDTNTLDVASNLLKVKDNTFQPLSSILTNTTASFTTTLETKLNGIADGAEVNVNADWSAVFGDAQILNKPTLLSQFTNDLGNYGGFLTTETDPIFAADSSKILHWSDTLNLTKGIASQYDLTTGLATKQNTLTTGNLTENVTGLQFDATRQVIGGAAQLSLTSGYVIPTTTEQTNWNTAYTDRNKWDGGATGLVAATGRTSLGGTTIGQNVFTSTNPSAIRFLRANADNTVSWLDAASFRTAIGAGTSSTNGTVTSVAMTTPTGLTVTGSPITTSGTFAISLTSGYSIPTTANQTNWTAGYNDKVNSLAFSGTTTKTLTLTQQDGGTVSNTFTDLDSQTLTTDSTATTIGITASGSNSRIHFNVDKSATNELQNLSLGTVTTTTQPLNISNGTGVTLPAATTSTAGLLTSADKTKLDGIATGANNYVLPLATNGTRGGIQIGYTATGANLPLQLSSEKGYVGLTNSAIVSGLGFTPYNATNPNGYTSNTGTVYSVAPGLGLAGGTITTSGTLSVDTASTVILSRQRAANTYQPKGTYQTGTESYILGLSLSGNTLTSTGVGSAFNGTVGNIANISTANTFAQNQTFNQRINLYNSSNYIVAGSSFFQIISANYLQLWSPTYFNIVNYDESKFFKFDVSTGQMYASSLLNGSTSNQLYYDSSTGEITYGAVPSIITQHNLLANLDYASSGHTGFAGTGVSNTFTQDQTISVFGAVSALRIKDSEDLAFGSLNSNTGYFYVRNGHPYFVNGDFGSSEIQLDAQGTTNHAALSNLSYATSGHTDFVSTNTDQTITGYKTFYAAPLLYDSNALWRVQDSYSGATTTGLMSVDNLGYNKSFFGFNNSADLTTIESYNDPAIIKVNAAERLRILTTGQLKLNNYTSTSAFTGTGVAALQVDASGNVITAAISGGSGTDLSFSGTSPVTLNSSTGADVTFTAGSNITLTRTSATNVTIAASSGATGDNISVNGTAAVDPNFISTGQIGFTYTTGSPNTIKADINNGSIYAVDLAYGTAPTNGQIPSFNSTTGGFTWVNQGSGGSMTYPSGSGIPRVVSGSSWGTTITIPGTTNTFLRGDGTFATIPGGFSDPMEAIGDMIFRDGSNNTVRLPKGNAGQLLTIVGNVPTWYNPFATSTAGVINYNNGSGLNATDADFTYTAISKTLNVGGSVISDESRVQTGLTTAMNVTNGYIGVTTVLTANRTITLSNMVDGHEGTIDVTQNATGGYTVTLAHSGLTIKKMGGKSEVNPTANSHTTIVYWRVGSILYYGFLYDN